jgi:uncharacterized protein with von Willebrand factor type A (vWA) domain
MKAWPFEHEQAELDAMLGEAAADPAVLEVLRSVDAGLRGLGMALPWADGRRCPGQRGGVGMEGATAAPRA